MYCIQWNINFSFLTVLIHNDRHNIARQCKIKMKRNFLELLIFSPQIYDDKFTVVNNIKIYLDERFNIRMTMLDNEIVSYYLNRSNVIQVKHISWV